MPELPDVEIYREALERFVAGRVLERVRLLSPFVLRSVDPPLGGVEGKIVRSVRRLGKRLVLGFEGDVFLVVHLMIAGRFHWKKPGTKLAGRVGLAAFDFLHGTLMLTEAASKKRASIHVVRGEEGLRAIDPGGAEPLTVDLEGFRAVLTRENHTLKRALTDPHILSGVGNSYSDEILHRAKLSPFQLTSKLTVEETKRLHKATRAVLTEWTDRLRKEVGAGFPEKVTAFRDGMAVHGRYGQSCPVCKSTVQRIVHAENESNYCATCQTGGKLLMDRALSKLLREDWPKTLDELERRRTDQGAPAPLPGR